MKLSEFITALTLTGKITLADKLNAFDDDDRTAAADQLNQFYIGDVSNMPGTAPVFNEAAALWAAEYLYRAMQLLLLRKEGPEAVSKWLPAYEGEINASAMYSADLSLRHLPLIFKLAKDWDPEDVLVMNISAITRQWPFSAVGTPFSESPSLPVVMADPSLRITYADRVAGARDLQRFKQDKAVAEIVTEALGAHAATLWPGLITT